METLYGAQGSIFASDCHDLWMQIMLKLDGFEQDSIAELNLQGWIQSSSCWEPYKSKCC
jgi:hypothetical protein